MKLNESFVPKRHYNDDKMNLIKQLGITLCIMIGLIVLINISYKYGYNHLLFMILFLFSTTILFRQKNWDGLEINLVSWGIFYSCSYLSNLSFLILPLIIIYFIIHKHILQYIIICPISSFKSLMYQIDDMIIIESYETSKFLLSKKGLSEDEIKQYFIKYQTRHNKNIEVITKCKLRGADFDIYKATIGIDKKEIF